MFNSTSKGSFQLLIDGCSRAGLNPEGFVNAGLNTRESLLSRLRKASNEVDWQSFYQQYHKVILSFCRKQGLDDFSADDVLQETMVLLMRKLPEFRYDPEQGKFRNWLLTLVAGKVRDAHKRARRAQLISLGETASELASRQSDVSDSVETDWRQALLEEALRQIKADPRVKLETFLVFQKCVFNGGSVTEVAREFQLEENAVYQIKSRMMRRLAAKVKALERDAKPR